MSRLSAYAAVAALFVVASVQAQPAPMQIRRNVSLIDVRNNTPVGANDFHLILSGINAADLYPDGFYNSDYAAPSVWTDTQNRVHIYWEGGNTGIGEWDKFGYALRGGVQYTGCEWFWTKDGQPIGNPLPDVLQDWVKVGNELRDVVRYRAPLDAPPVQIQRTAGEQFTMAPDSFFDIFLELSMPQPPGAVVVDPAPVTLVPNTQLTYPWTLPGIDPMYFMFYDVSIGGQPVASFHNMAEVPEPASLGLFALAGLLGLRRRR